LIDPVGKLLLTPQLLGAIAEIDEFKGRWSALGDLAPDRLSALRRIATIESVGSSTRIEGAKLTDAEVEALLSGLEVRSFRSRDEQEVAGYAELMELIFTSWREIDLTENHVRQLHGVLLKRSHKDERHRGEYKKLPNHVEAFDATGASVGGIFETASPFDTPRLMRELVDWTREALVAAEHHALLLVAVFVVRFLAIHPFQDGNGRLSRALTTLLLLRAGYAYVPYRSLERVVEDNKQAYYRALRRAQSTLDRGESLFGEWITFFLDCLVRQKVMLARTIEAERLMTPLAPLSAQILSSSARTVASPWARPWPPPVPTATRSSSISDSSSTAAGSPATAAVAEPGTSGHEVSPWDPGPGSDSERPRRGTARGFRRGLVIGISNLELCAIRHEHEAGAIRARDELAARMPTVDWLGAYDRAARGGARAALGAMRDGRQVAGWTGVGGGRVRRRAASMVAGEPTLRPASSNFSVDRRIDCP
jgi:Fic family protein